MVDVCGCVFRGLTSKKVPVIRSAEGFQGVYAGWADGLCSVETPSIMFAVQSLSFQQSLRNQAALGKGMN